MPVEKTEKLEKRPIHLLKPLPEVMKTGLKQIEEKLEDYENESERDRREEFYVDLPEFKKTGFAYRLDTKSLSQSANFSSNVSSKTNTMTNFMVFSNRSQYKSTSSKKFNQ